MSWTDKLLQTYELCSSKTEIELEGEKKAQDRMLAPIYHLTQQAQIEVVLNREGQFLSADIVEKENAVTLIPVSKDSVSRSSGISPHPLHDKLQYVAQDYAVYVDQTKEKYYEKYIQNLHQWVTSPYTHQSIQIIYTYLSKGRLIQDLIEYGILVEENGKLDKKTKFQKTINQAEAFVRFCVMDAENNILLPWEDASLYQSFIDFNNSLYKDDKDICYITGELAYCTDKHPGKIRYSSDNAKLISSNDESGFTFRGRFSKKENALSIGYETSQKIHNALRWLIHEQGYQKDGLTVLIWNVENKPIFNNLRKQRRNEETSKVDTSKVYAENMLSMIHGYKKFITPRDGVVIMMLEAATPGRLSITCYQELSASQYYKNVEGWYQDCVWLQYNYIKSITTPSIDDIIKTVYGDFRNKEMVVDKNLDIRVRKLILPCILFGQRMPKELLRQAYRQALKLSKTDKIQWQKCVGILCAFMRKESIERKQKNGKGAVWSMDRKENEENGLESTAYIYGEVLAVYHEIERYALSNTDKDRETNAMRYMVQCKRFPWKTINIIDSLSQPYLKKLGKKGNKLAKLKTDVVNKLLKQKDAKSIRNLSYDFIMGFECQKLDYENYIKRLIENKENEEVETEEF